MEDKRRSRPSREANNDNSFGSYSSASDDESSESMDDRKYGYNHSTEYESNSDGSSYSVMSEDEYKTPNTTEIYESDGFGRRQDSRDSVSGSSGSRSSKEDDFENSFGDFKVDEFVYDKNKHRNNKDSADESPSINSGEEDVKMSEQDDDSFWKRSGYDKKTGGFEDDESEHSYGDDSSRSRSRFSSQRSGSDSFGGSDSDSDDEGRSRDFDDGDRFKDEAAFPSINMMLTEDSADRTEVSSERSGASGGGGGKGGGDFTETIKGWFAKCCSLLDCSEVFQGKFKWYIIGGIILIFIGIIIAIALPKNGKDGMDDSTTEKPWVVNSMPPTVSPVILSTQMPTLPPGQMMDAVTFFVLIPNGKLDSITEEELEMEFSAAFDILAPQVLFNSTELNNKNRTDSDDIQENQTVVETKEEGNGLVRLRGRRRRGRRKLEALSVKTPCLVDVIEIGMLNGNK
jgi:hypothetical protein